MSAKFKVAEIAELALGKIGAFTVAMVAADPDEMVRTVKWMDIVVAELVGTNRAYWLTPQSVTAVLTAAVPTYTLSTLLGTSYPADGIQFPTQAFIVDAAGSSNEVELISRQAYERIDTKTDVGSPTKIYIDRLNDTQKISVYPVPSDGTLSLRLVFQTFATNLTEGTPEFGGNVRHGFSVEWQKWLITATAAEIGNGPVRRLPLQEVHDMKQDASISLLTLINYSNTQKTTTPKRTKGMI